MNTYKLKFTVLQLEILKLLMRKTGESFSLRQIAKLLEVSPAAVGKAIKKLQEKKLIKIKKHPTLNFLSTSINRENKTIIELKKIENQKEILESGLLDKLKEKFPGRTIILFGSYSKGEDTIKSDIDIAILGKAKAIKLKKEEEYLERQINLEFLPINQKGALDIQHKHLKENLHNGIVLSGGFYENV